MPDHSYVTIRSRLSASVQDILGSVTEKLQYSEEPAGREDSLILVAVASSGGERVRKSRAGGPGEKFTSLVPWSRVDCRHWTSHMSITWELVKNATFQAPLQTCWTGM